MRLEIAVLYSLLRFQSNTIFTYVMWVLTTVMIRIIIRLLNPIQALTDVKT